MLTAYNGTSISYDAIGNPTSYYNGWNFTWQQGREMATATKGSQSLSFTYDADGIRRTKTVNGVEHIYYYVGGKLARETYSGNVLDFFYDQNGHPFMLVYNGSVYYYITNAQGDVIRLTNTNGETAARYQYDPYGNIIDSAGSHVDINPLRYRGYYYDSETNLYYLQSRYYDPNIGRFINSDAETNLGADDGFVGLNLFAYCLNNPVNRTDETGAASLPNWAKIAIGVGIIAAAAAITIATGGAAAGTMVAAIHCVAQGALVGAITQGAIGAVSGAASGAITHRISTGSWEGAANAAVDGAATGFMTGTITGAISGAVSSPYCFVAGTTVLTAASAVAIETIKAGDMVWAWDEETGDVALKKVVETYENTTDALVHVHVKGEEIITTPSHPFYSPVKGWTDAVHLRAGDILVLVNGEYVVVEKVQHELLESPVAVYNFHVEDYHTYYVSDLGVLVHNRCGAPFDENQQAVLDIAKEYKKTGISRSEGNILVEWANEYGISNHGPMIHERRGGIWGTLEHIKIKNYHIQIW